MKNINSLVLLVILMNCQLTFSYTYDANDFATQVISYSQGTDVTKDFINLQYYNNPQTALGRPTVDTTGNNYDIPLSTIVPVVSVYSPFRSFEIVTIGTGGQLILKFNHHVVNDGNNPYGYDFIIFGNCQQNAGHLWLNGNPSTFTINYSSLIQDPGIVYVSQDGNNWVPFTSPKADTWAPTFGRIYDPNHPDANIGTWNLWWGKPTNPTIPLDPDYTASSFVGHTVAYMSQKYGQSAGGTAFDLEDVGLEWIQYVKIVPSSSYTPEIDAVSDVKPCPVGDFDFSYKVDWADLQILSDYWLQPVNNPDDPAAAVNLYNDTIINFKDYAVFANNWLIDELKD